VKIRSVAANNRRKVFEVRVGTAVLPFPYSKAERAPAAGDPVVRVTVDEELAREAFVFELRSGRSGTVHVEQVLEHNQDPSYLRDLLLYKLTLEAQRRMATSALSKREICRRLGTSATQFYRLLDQTNYGKSIDQVLRLLRALDCDVDLVVRARTA
jgi:predicted DNA-binding transcriptional regulator AlpA